MNTSEILAREKPPWQVSPSSYITTMPFWPRVSKSAGSQHARSLLHSDGRIRTGVTPPLSLEETKAEAFAGLSIVSVARRVVAARILRNEVVADIDVVGGVVRALVNPVDAGASSGLALRSSLA